MTTLQVPEPDIPALSTQLDHCTAATIPVRTVLGGAVIGPVAKSAGPAFLFILLLVFVCFCVWVGARVPTAGKLRSEDNFVELILSLCLYADSEMELR